MPLGPNISIFAPDSFSTLVLGKDLLMKFSCFGKSDLCK